MIKVFKIDLLRKTSTYTFFNILDRLVPFIILPILSRQIGAEGMGLYSIYQSILAFLLPIATLNAGDAILRNYYEKEKISFPVYFTNSFIILLFGLLITFIVIWSFNSLLDNYLGFPGNWLYLIILVAFFQYITKINLSLFQIKEQAKYYGIFKTILTTLKFVLMLTFVLVLRFNWEGLMVAQLIAIFFMFIFSIIYFIKMKLFKPSFNWAFIIDNLKIGTPMIFQRIGGWLNSLAGRVVLNSLLGAAITGHYSIGATFGIIVAILQDSFNLAFVPFLFEKLTNPNAEDNKKLVRLTYMYHLSILIVALIISFIGRELVTFIFGNEFIDAKKYILWVCLGYAFNGSYKMHANYIFFKKMTYLNATITVISGTANILLIFILIKLFGEIGVAIAFCIAAFISFILAWYIGNKLIPLPWIKH